MAASDAKPIPRKNVAHRVYFPIYDADGDLIADATGLLGLTSVDAAPLATTSAAPVQVSTSSGIYFCDLTAGEMNGDGVIAKFTSSSAGAKAAVIIMYPQEGADIRVSVSHWDNAPVVSPGVAGLPKVDVTHWISTAVATPTVNGVPEVDVTHIAGSTTDVSTIPATIVAILDDTDDIGVAGAGLTAIDLPDQTMNITGNITGNLSGSVGSVTGAVGSVTGAVGSVTATVNANVVEWQDSPAASVGVAGIPKVDVTHWLGTAAATPTTAGVPEVDITHINGLADGATRLARSTTAIVLGTVGTSSTTTAIKFSSLAPASVVNDQFVGRIITFDLNTTTTALRGQSTDITDYVHATLIATVTALTTAPVSGDTCVIT